MMCPPLIPLLNDAESDIGEQWRDYSTYAKDNFEFERTVGYRE
jgi:hypothetical protein